MDERRRDTANELARTLVAATWTASGRTGSPEEARAVGVVDPRVRPGERAGRPGVGREQGHRRELSDRQPARGRARGHPARAEAELRARRRWRHRHSGDHYHQRDPVHATPFGRASLRATLTRTRPNDNARCQGFGPPCGVLTALLLAEGVTVIDMGGVRTPHTVVHTAPVYVRRGHVRPHGDSSDRRRHGAAGAGGRRRPARLPARLYLRFALRGAPCAPWSGSAGSMATRR